MFFFGNYTEKSSSDTAIFEDITFKVDYSNRMSSGSSVKERRKKKTKEEVKEEW